MNVIPKINGVCRKEEGFCSAPEKVGFKAEPGLPAEGYVLDVTPEGVTIAHSDESGKAYALETLSQLKEDGGLPCCHIEDAPRYAYRGYMVDSGRHFFPVEEIEKMIDLCAKLKLNMFHWHLSEDQGFRIESKRFPRLNEISSWRTEEDGTRYGGYYTQEEIRRVVAHAKEKHITVIPEIDLPGHTVAIVAAYPELSCSGEPTQVECHWGIFPRILCAGNEKVYEFLFQLLDEVCELFPGPYFHIGGDEAPKQEWEKCPLCQQKIREEGLEGEEDLQAWFTARLVEYLNARGKTVIGWNEILASGTLGLGAVAQYWTNGGAEYSAREIPRGRKFIFSNSDSFYVDYDPSLITMEGIYAFEPYIPGGEDIKPEQVLGTEAPLWSERIETPERLEWMAFPRLAALAENAWAADRDFGCFVERMKVYEKTWRQQGVNAQPVEEAVAFDPAVCAGAAEKQIRAWMFDKPEEEIKARLQKATGMGIAGFTSPTFTRGQLEKIAAEMRKLGA